MSGRNFFLETVGGGQESLGADYDAEGDVLYLWRGDGPTEAISFPMDSGPIVRVDPETGELVGVTIVDFMACWSETERIELHMPAVGRSEPEAAEHAAEHRELVFA